MALNTGRTITFTIDILQSNELKERIIHWTVFETLTGLPKKLVYDYLYADSDTIVSSPLHDWQWLRPVLYPY